MAVRQIGRINILAISGGRIVALDENTIALPVSSGYSVEVEYLPGPDLYEVRRVFTRRAPRPRNDPFAPAGPKVRTVKGRQTGLYADQIGEAAYQASCYKDGPWGES